MARLLRAPMSNHNITPKRRRDAAMLALLCATGISAAEFTALNLGDLARGDAELHVRERVLPIYPTALRTVIRYLDYTRFRLSNDPHQRAMFVTIRGQRMLTVEVTNIVRRYGREVEVVATAQIIRHTFAMNLLAAGATQCEVQALLGCSTAPVYQYNHFLQERLQSA
jgi:integrase/recombinase XerD